MKILMIDNFDSFTYNLVDEFEKRNCHVEVYRNNIGLENFRKIANEIKPDLIVISPGPSSPKDAGMSIEVIRQYTGKVPIFGVCLGHQCIIESFGGIVGRAPEVLHGKPSRITHDGKSIFMNIESPFQVGRYHSLAGIKIPEELRVSAETDTGIVMGIRHKTLFVEGVQFHPESILTPNGGLLIENLLQELRNYNGDAILSTGDLE
jgi:anthranilate synthase/aminodeoxychorismate synthase-like glutamine amidotransferase